MSLQTHQIVCMNHVLFFPYQGPVHRTVSKDSPALGAPWGRQQADIIESVEK